MRPLVGVKRGGGAEICAVLEVKEMKCNGGDLFVVEKNLASTVRLGGHRYNAPS